jgi:hypothetical protein
MADYRLYSLFHLRKLKVLDGTPVEPSEASAASDMFLGRLNEDILLQRAASRPFNAIVDLDLSSLRLRDLADLITSSNFPALRAINVDHNLLADLSPLSRLPSLISLRACHNRVSSLLPKASPPLGEPVGLESLTALEALHLANNLLTSLAPLRLFPLLSLRVLDLQDNDISKVEGLDCFSNLRELNLDRNKLRGFEPASLASLSQLRTLSVEENGVRSLQHLPPLHRLSLARFASNRITDVADIERIAALPSLLDLTLANNPLSRKQMYRATVIFRVTSLTQLDNKDISQDERERVDMLFHTDARAQAVIGLGGAVNFAPSPAPANPASLPSSASKVPIKIASVTFDQMTGVGGPSPSPSPFMCIGLSRPPPQDQPQDWHPFFNSPGEFFLPSGKLSGRRAEDVPPRQEVKRLTSRPRSGERERVPGAAVLVDRGGGVFSAVGTGAGSLSGGIAMGSARPRRGGSGSTPRDRAAALGGVLR